MFGLTARRPDLAMLVVGANSGVGELSLSLYIHFYFHHQQLIVYNYHFTVYQIFLVSMNLKTLE